ncbi:MAG: hypothetical protein LKJ69_10655 [Lactobacillus sp.]|jgi:hypothetical protein|nr:hypothetical protein [Lactobacillus sp.]MCI2033824.1 hypothetical protein [Lactobacillus sp.]
MNEVEKELPTVADVVRYLSQFPATTSVNFISLMDGGLLVTGSTIYYDKSHDEVTIMGEVMAI